MEVYPPDLRGWIARHGGLTSKIIYLQGRDLSAIVPACAASASASARAPAPPQTCQADATRATSIAGPRGAAERSWPARHESLVCRVSAYHAPPRA
jgi:hypothetical protein